MVTTTSTFISVGEEEKHKAYKHSQAAVIKEGREMMMRTVEQTWEPGETAGGRTPAHRLPHPMPRSATGRRNAHGPGATTPKVTRFTAGCVRFLLRVNAHFPFFNIFESAMTLDLCLLPLLENIYTENPNVEILWCSYP